MLNLMSSSMKTLRTVSLNSYQFSWLTCTNCGILPYLLCKHTVKDSWCSGKAVLFRNAYESNLKLVSTFWQNSILYYVGCSEFKMCISTLSHFRFL